MRISKVRRCYNESKRIFFELLMLPLYVTSGEPAGIGPDIVLSLAARIDERPIVVLGRYELATYTCSMLGICVELIEYSGREKSSTAGSTLCWSMSP